MASASDIPPGSAGTGGKLQKKQKRLSMFSVGSSLWDSQDADEMMETLKLLQEESSVPLSGFSMDNPSGLSLDPANFFATGHSVSDMHSTPRHSFTIDTPFFPTLSPTPKLRPVQQIKKEPVTSSKGILRKQKPTARRSKLLKLEQVPINNQPRGIDINPRDFVNLVKVLGGHLILGPHETEIVLAQNQAPFYPAIEGKLGFVEHEFSYIMAGSIPFKERRRYDVFSDREINDAERSFWCDQGNAHAVIDTSRPLRETAIQNNPINPRTIQVAHALANRVAPLLGSEKPVVKCFYYSLHRRPIMKRKRIDKNEKIVAQPNCSLGLHKHIYCLCEQNVQDRHKPLTGSQVWLVRYFVKGELHRSVRPFVRYDETQPKVLRPHKSSSTMSLC